LAEGGQGGFSESVAEAEIELRDLGGGGGGAFGDAEDFGAECFGKRTRGVVDEFGWRVGADSGQSYFDGVGGGAGHQAEEEKGFLGHVS